MKIAIYTIALNEEANAEKFMESCSGADLVAVGDTGSTDNTNEIIENQGGQIIPINVAPWRFDTARNTMLSLIPKEIDLCIPLDLDERLPENWRDQIEKAWTNNYDRIKFRYVHHTNGENNKLGIKDFIHTRTNYRWEHIVHEQLKYTGPGQESFLTLYDFIIKHEQDGAKDRSSYIKLLEQECAESHSPRHIFWLAREYIYKQEWGKAKTWLERFLETENKWKVEHAQCLRYLAKVSEMQSNQKLAVLYYIKAVEVAPESRENWVALANYYYSKENWALAYCAIKEALKITSKSEHYLTELEVWGDGPYKLAANCAKKLNIQPDEKVQLTNISKLTDKRITQIKRPGVTKRKIKMS